MNPTFEVTQGIIHVNSISILRCNNDVLCFYVDFKQKYPSVGPTAENLEFSFVANEDTLKVTDPNAPPTVIKVVGVPEDWNKYRLQISIRMGRYDATVFVVKEDPEINNAAWFDE